MVRLVLVGASSLPEPQIMNSKRPSVFASHKNLRLQSPYAKNVYLNTLPSP